MSNHDLQERLIRAGTYVVAAIAWAVTGYLTNVRQDEDVDFDTTKFTKTIFVGAVAGVIMFAMGDELTHDAFLTAMTIAIPIADRLLNRAIDAARVTEELAE